jgi:hypothetical protein
VEISQFENQEHYRRNREEHHRADIRVRPRDTSIGLGILAHEDYSLLQMMNFQYDDNIIPRQPARFVATD